MSHMPDPQNHEEFFKWIEDSTRRAAREALRIYVRGTAAAVAALLAALVFVFLSDNAQRSSARQAIVDSGDAVSVSGCNRDFTTIMTLRGVLSASQEARKTLYERGALGKDEYETGKQFFTKQLILLELPDCRDSLHVLTDDPNAEIVVPTPRFPGDNVPNKSG